MTALGNGAVGVDRLSAVGAPLLPLAAALTLEVVLGALLWLAIALVRERHERKRPEQSRAEESASPQSTRPSR